MLGLSGRAEFTPCRTAVDLNYVQVETGSQLVQLFFA